MTVAQQTARPLRIGTRGSPLALAQAAMVRAALVAAHAGLAPERIEIVPIRTTGDRIQDRPLAEAGGKGLFTKEIEEALLAGTVDLAVHSMKDMPTALPARLAIGAMLAREDARDALIAPRARSIGALPQDARVGTSSLRRQALLRHLRPDLRVVDFRGNVETRLRKLEAGEAEATLLALAGLKRLGLADRAAAIVDPAQMLPAVAQGAIGIECRAEDEAALALLARLDHAPTSACIAAERAMLAVLEGSCRTPIAGYAELADGSMHLRGAVARPDGSEVLRGERRGPAADGERMGGDLGAELRRRAGPGFFAA